MWHSACLTYKTCQFSVLYGFLYLCIYESDLLTHGGLRAQYHSSCVKVKSHFCACGCCFYKCVGWYTQNSYLAIKLTMCAKECETFYVCTVTLCSKTSALTSESISKGETVQTDSWLYFWFFKTAFNLDYTVLLKHLLAVFDSFIIMKEVFENMSVAHEWTVPFHLVLCLFLSFVHSPHIQPLARILKKNANVCKLWM